MTATEMPIVRAIKGSKVVMKKYLKNNTMQTSTYTPISPVSHKSASDTPNTLPKRKSFMSRCTPSRLVSQDMPMMPSANIAVNTMPIEASSLVMELRCIQVIITEVMSPAATAPAKMAKGLCPKSIKPTTTPGRMACDRASPMRAIRLSTTKQPNIPQVIPTTDEAINALMA